MKKIKLTQGKFALVDNKDFEWLNQWKWHCTFFGYAARRKGKQILWMHREIIKTPIGFETDHINMNKLDNRRKNLRIATLQQNAFNRDKRKTNTSGYKGVGWHKQRSKWRAYLNFDKKQISLGLFDDKLEAVKIYNQTALKYFGEFARLNKI